MNLKLQLRELAARSQRVVEFGTLDLGEKPPSPAMEAASPKRWYPTLHLSDLSEEFPLGDEGTAKITYKVKRRSSEKVDGKEKFSATIEVRTIETPDRPASSMAQKK
jgi:hypothetical protein